MLARQASAELPSRNDSINCGVNPMVLPMGIEHIEIPKCPKCHNRHNYRLEVDRSIVMKLITMEDLDEPTRWVKVTRIFICPTKNEKFEARIRLADTSSNRIKDVAVIGVSNEDD